MDINNPSVVIDQLGGSGVVAKLCNVRSQAVSQWRKDGIPDARLMFLKLARPEVFKAISENAA